MSLLKVCTLLDDRPKMIWVVGSRLKFEILFRYMSARGKLIAFLIFQFAKMVPDIWLRGNVNSHRTW